MNTWFMSPNGAIALTILIASSTGLVSLTAKATEGFAD
jgi:hypothetical protein